MLFLQGEISLHLTAVMWCRRCNCAAEKPNCLMAIVSRLTNLLPFLFLLAVLGISKRFRKLEIRHNYVIKHLQANVTTYRKAIATLWLDMPWTNSEALILIHPHFIEKVFRLLSGHVKLRSKGSGRWLPLWSKNLPCTWKWVLKHTGFCPHV